MDKVGTYMENSNWLRPEEPAGDHVVECFYSSALGVMINMRSEGSNDDNGRALSRCSLFDFIVTF
jgi:hypothetical protein